MVKSWGLGRFVLGAGIILGDLKGDNLQIFDLHRLASLNLDHFFIKTKRFPNHLKDSVTLSKDNQNLYLRSIVSLAYISCPRSDGFLSRFFFLFERKRVAATKYSAIIFSYARSTISKEKKGVFEQVKLSLKWLFS